MLEYFIIVDKSIPRKCEIANCNFLIVFDKLLLFFRKMFIIRILKILIYVSRKIGYYNSFFLSMRKKKLVTLNDYEINKIFLVINS